MKSYNSSEDMYIDMEDKVEQLTKAVQILLEAIDWNDVQEVGGEPLQDAIENANAVLKYVEESDDEPSHETPDALESDWCDFCEMSVTSEPVQGYLRGNCPHCGQMVS